MAGRFVAFRHKRNSRNNGTTVAFVGVKEISRNLTAGVDLGNGLRVILSVVEVLTTLEAAEQAGVTVRQWHYLVGKHEITPVRSLKGVRGAKLWRPADVRKIARLVEQAA